MLYCILHPYSNFNLIASLLHKNSVLVSLKYLHLLKQITFFHKIISIKITLYRNKLSIYFGICQFNNRQIMIYFSIYKLLIDLGGYMKKELITAIITGVIGAVGGSAATYTITNNNSSINTNGSNNTIIINRDGKEIEITADDYEQLAKDNEQLEEDNKKLEESLKNNQEKSASADLENSNFIDTLYDGQSYKKSLSSNNDESLSIGGKTYTDSFEIFDDGFVLFNLEGKYSKVNMDIGRIDDSSVTDAEIKIYLDDKLSGSYKINAEKTLTNIDIDLAGANNMKIALESEAFVEYGFVNVTAEKN